MFAQKIDTNTAATFPYNRYQTIYKDSSYSPQSYNMLNTSPSSTNSQLYPDDGSNDDLESQHRKRYGRPPGAKDKKPRRRRTKAQMEEDALLYGIKTEEEPWQSPSLKRRRLSRTTSLGDLHVYNNRSPVFNKMLPDSFLAVNGPFPINGHSHHIPSAIPLARIDPFQHPPPHSTNRAYSIVSPLTTSPGDWQRSRPQEVDFSQRSTESHLNNRTSGLFGDSYIMPFHASSIRHRRSISPASSTFKSLSDGRSSQRSSYTHSESGTSFASARRDSGSGESAVTSPSDYRLKLSVPHDGRYDNNSARGQRYSDSKSPFGSQSSSSSVGVQLTLQLPQIPHAFRRTVPTLKDILNDTDPIMMDKPDGTGDEHHGPQSRHIQEEARPSRYIQTYDDKPRYHMQARRPDIRRLVSS